MEISEEQHHSGTSSDEEDQPPQKDEEVQDFEYKLVGVCCHMGLADAGHYLSYINVERDHENNINYPTKSREEWLQTDKQTWLEFNDGTVQRF